MSTAWANVAALIPEQATEAREAALLALVEQGQSVLHDWTTLSVSGAGHVIELSVSADALRLGDETDSVRITVNATTAQQIADHFDALLLTPLVSDRIRAAAAVVLEPATQPAGPTMATTARMVEHSRAVDARRAAAGGAPGSLTATVGKDWVLTNRLWGLPDRAANYGWHTSSAAYAAVTPALHVLQPLGIAHNRFHVDYSQTWRGMRRSCRVDGEVRDLVEVLRDPVLSRLVSHEGPLKVFAVPSVSSGAVSPAPMPPVPVLSVPRTLRLGMEGADVSAWQRVLGLVETGMFDSSTDEATRAFQSAHGLVPDGLVGPLTRAAVGGLFPFVQAKHFGKGRGARIDTVVLHTMEAAEKPETAERVAAWFGGPNAPVASAHYCVDADSIVQCVRESDTAFHAPGVNQRSIGVEHAGFAAQSAEDWADVYSETMLRRSASLVASVCGRYGIPIAYIDEAALKAGASGITTHAAVSRAFKKSTHTDPGPSFPLEHYLAMVREHAG
jgi:peptidoglycan hydrolase-like protein with peptidoglycan-binding domain